VFVQALRDLGLVNGHNVLIEPRSVEGRPDRMPALMQEMVNLDVDVIVTFGSPGVRAALRATDRIAIVGLIDNISDTGLIDTLAKPGHNFTGISENFPELDGKRLQMLKEAAPSITRVAVLGYRLFPGQSLKSRAAFEAAARTMGIDVLWIGVDAPEDIEAAFATILRERVQAVYANGTHVNYANAKRIANFTLQHGLPSFGFPKEGMLMTYEANFDEMLRRAALLVKKILQGVKPADLPFEQPTKFELVINTRTAKALGLTISTSMLQRADALIE
jgi:putative ABC transport system substrate-binding protein